MVASGVRKKVEGETLLKIIDRRAAIEKALSIAAKGDTVLIAGKGCEKIIMMGSEALPWDDAEIVREFFEKRDSTAVASVTTSPTEPK